MVTPNSEIEVDREKGNFRFAESHKYDAGIGLSEKVIDYICDVKEEDQWIRDFRKRALKVFESKPMPTNWATKDLENIDFDKIRYYLAGANRASRSWDDVPDDVKQTFERLGIPENERKFLAGVEAQFDSEAAYSNIKESVGKQGVIFMGSTEGLMKHPEIFKKWFGKVIPTGDNKFSALNSAVFSGGSFIYVPPGVKVSHPLQAYFRINAENFGQFERTLIIADEGSEVTYMEGCTAPKFDTATLHSAVVELVAMPGAKIEYVTVQNWSSNVFNLVTKRAIAHEGATVKWIDCNIGSRLTMKYPGVVLKGKKARGEVLSIALANDGQHQDTGAKMIHAADETTSNIISKSISVGQGRSTYRGQVHMPKNLKGCKNNTECDALLINDNSRTDTYPAITVRGNKNAVQHEASVSKVSAEQIFYMQQRGLSEGEAMSLSVNGFVNDLTRQFPMEYSVELKRLIELEMEGSVG
ncbi:Fe-S cluster assembly protein SufB [Pelagicoccus sp. NFK12]|uniref:Fe-S cluster assembly protein SufB n=1 Tax=Pelagicoccus enzymogenes TaxID=2773457 RepID=A0A927FBQ3_9BACT|nr:Fe-S cluster assembly protein SufB [Pelagicoccus enzymogenes]MBD5780513.1 Fe-S cluster assembly protein SufB [Pelagicoccus enzymogenes]MDQ8197587.1 Fe-S cluster assembly protein SufB [Pelagicoccus enzymogenes]